MTTTPLIKLGDIYFKREDKNQTGSAKDRAIQEQIKQIQKLGIKKAVISSTGNAAISAAYFCSQNNINLNIFLSSKINPNKLAVIKKYSTAINFSLKPISDAIKFSKFKKAYLLRQSTDLFALIGYQQIGNEIIKQLPQITSIFIPVGSGTTLLGVSQSLPKTVKIFAIQPSANCPLSKIFDQSYFPETKLITDALSAKFLPQKTEIIKAVKNSNGFGLVVQNQEIISADDYLKKQKINTSLEGALALAGYFKAQKSKLNPGDHPLILLTGAKR